MAPLLHMYVFNSGPYLYLKTWHANSIVHANSEMKDPQFDTIVT